MNKLSPLVSNLIKKLVAYNRGDEVLFIILYPGPQGRPYPKLPAGAYRTMNFVKSHPLVILEWLDHTEPGESHWTNEAYEGNLTTCFSVGWIIAEDEEKITIVPHKYYSDDDEGYSTPLFIVRKAVINRWFINDLPEPDN